MKKKVLINIIAVCLLLGVIFFLQELFMPKYMSEIPEGNLIEEYYKEEKKHDVIFIGDCEVFSNISPLLYGKNSELQAT